MGPNIPPAHHYSASPWAMRLAKLLLQLPSACSLNICIQRMGICAAFIARFVENLGLRSRVDGIRSIDIWLFIRTVCGRDWLRFRWEWWGRRWLGFVQEDIAIRIWESVITSAATRLPLSTPIVWWRCLMMVFETYLLSCFRVRGIVMAGGIGVELFFTVLQDVWDTEE